VVSWRTSNWPPDASATKLVLSLRVWSPLCVRRADPGSQVDFWLPGRGRPATTQTATPDRPDRLVLLDVVCRGTPAVAAYGATYFDLNVRACSSPPTFPLPDTVDEHAGSHLLQRLTSHTMALDGRVRAGITVPGWTRVLVESDFASRAYHRHCRYADGLSYAEIDRKLWVETDLLFTAPAVSGNAWRAFKLSMSSVAVPTSS
jgi:hypothetical protein